jgi:hypothetical protein
MRKSSPESRGADRELSTWNNDLGTHEWMVCSWKMTTFERDQQSEGPDTFKLELSSEVMDERKKWTSPSRKVGYEVETHSYPTTCTRE